MRYLIKITIETINYTYPIDANNEDEAKERLLLRLPPEKRDAVVINNITIDPASIPHTDSFGIFSD
jgi:hypothetical protein